MQVFIIYKCEPLLRFLCSEQVNPTSRKREIFLLNLKAFLNSLYTQKVLL